MSGDYFPYSIFFGIPLPHLLDLPLTALLLKERGKIIEIFCPRRTGGKNLVPYFSVITHFIR